MFEMQETGVMLYYSYNKTSNSPDIYYGLTIASATLDDNRLQIGFTNGTKVDVYDTEQQCCENRYISTDDDLSSLVGHVLLRIEAKEGPQLPDNYEVHETCFVEIGTNIGFVTLTTHNEHNGYYSGFALVIEQT
jgi:hypothetical protein